MLPSTFMIFKSRCNSTYRLRYWNHRIRCFFATNSFHFFLLQQYLPLAVLKHGPSLRYDVQIRKLQQYLPLAVLKPNKIPFLEINLFKLVATVLTACGIETWSGFGTPSGNEPSLQQYLPLAVLKPLTSMSLKMPHLLVATVLTACGIETGRIGRRSCLLC